MSEERLSKDEAGFEATLAGLRPATAGLDRDRVMYLAGLAAGKCRQAGTIRRGAWRTAWLWPCTTAAALLLALGAIGWMAAGPRVVERVVFVESPAPPAASPSVAEIAPAGAASPWSDAPYLRLRELVLSAGVDAIPSPSGRSETGRVRVWSAAHADLDRLLGG